MICIYCLTSPSGKSYIGQTCNIEKRILKYKQLDCKSQTKLYHALLKYGFDAFKISIVEECEKHELDSCEMFWIMYFQTVSNGYNLKYGGKGGSPSIETRIKMGSWQKGKILSDETKYKMSQSKKGNKCCHFGKKFSIETREKMSRNIKLSRINNKNPNRGIVKNRNKFCVKLTENEIYYCKYGFKTIDSAKIYRESLLSKK